MSLRPVEGLPDIPASSILMPRPSDHGEVQRPGGAPLGEVLTLGRGARLPPARTAVIRVLSGTLRACRLLPDGRRQVTAFLFPGDWCLTDPCGGHWAMVEAVTDARLVRTTRSRLRAAPGAEADGALEVALEASLAAALDRVATLGQKTARDKLASFLLDLSERIAGGGAEIRLPMSRYDIADHLGLRPETVGRGLGQLVAAGVIALPEPQRVRILDRPALQAVRG